LRQALDNSADAGNTAVEHEEDCRGQANQRTADQGGQLKVKFHSRSSAGPLMAMQPSSAIVNSVPFAHTGRALAMAAVHMQAHALKDMIHVQIESLAFVKRRCEQDLRLIDDLITSEKYHNTFGVYGEFCRDAFSEYAAETCKLMSIGSRLVSDAAKFANSIVGPIRIDG
jgi:hypothetical protein